jgi:hypothetical protein
MPGTGHRQAQAHQAHRDEELAHGPPRHGCAHTIRSYGRACAVPVPCLCRHMVQNDRHRHAQSRDGRAGRAFFVGGPGGPHGGGTPRSITGARSEGKRLPVELGLTQEFSVFSQKYCAPTGPAEHTEPVKNLLRNYLGFGNLWRECLARIW